MSDKFKKLVLDHAAAVAEFKRLKSEGCAAQSKCLRIVNDWQADTCIRDAYTENAEDNRDCGPYDGYDYESTFQNLDPPACEHCILVRKLKKERGAVGRRIGAIRAAMTRAAQAEMRVGQPKESPL